MKKCFCLLLAALFLCGCTAQTPIETPPPPPAEEELPPEPVTATARLTFTGDIMCHSYQYNEAWDKETKTYDFSHNFTDMKPYFSAADLVVGNLETVFAGEERGAQDFPLFNSPDAFLQAVKEAGFDVVTCANNHCLDQGEVGVTRTVALLNDLGLDHVGIYRSPEEKEEGRVLMKEVNGIKLAFVAWTYGFNGNYVPSYDMVSLLTEEAIASDIALAKTHDPDFIIALPHLGNEYETFTKDVFKGWVELMFEAGADIVIASHPHVLQPMEYRTLTKEDGSTRRGFAAYSMGNFISSQTTPPRNAGMLLHLDLKKTEGEPAELTGASFTPIWTQFRSAENINRFKVRSVYQMLTLSEEAQAATLRPQDVRRLKEIHGETAEFLLQKEIPLEEIQDTYVFPLPAADGE